MEKRTLLAQLEEWDLKKEPCLLVYKTTLGKIVEERTVIRGIVKQNGRWFILTESGMPIAIAHLAYVQQ